MGMEEQIMEYATQKYSGDGNTPPNAEIANEAPQTPENAPQAEIANEQPPASVPETPDYSKILSELTSGEVSDVDTLKSFLTKGKEYDTILSKNTELEEKLKVDPFANEFSKSFNDMLKSGKSKDEIDAFYKASTLDIDALSAKEAKVMQMVREGYNAEIAKKMVEKEFPIDEYEEGDEERQILEEKLRVSAISAKESLKQWKKDVMTVDTTLADQAEQQRLESIANEQSRRTQIKQNAPTIASQFTGLGELNLNGKEGEEALKLKFDYSEDFKSQLPQRIESFFTDGLMELTPENIKHAEHYAKADYLVKNIDSIVQDVFKHAVSITEERMVNKYENRSGLPPETPALTPENQAMQMGDFLNKVVTGKFN